MQHDHALRTHAAERYLLGEMPADERALYEEHFFSCAECEAELAAAAVFVDNARAVLREATQGARADIRNAPPEPPWWRRLFVAPPPALVPALGGALAVLIAIAGYQQLRVIPDLRERLTADETLSAVPTVALRSASRGSSPVVTVRAADRFAVIQADVIPERKIDRYAVFLTTAHGGAQWRTSIPAPEPGIPATILLPVRELAAGDYALVFEDAEQDGREVARFAFTLDKQ
jgi:hypothetical protein